MSLFGKKVEEVEEVKNVGIYFHSGRDRYFRIEYIRDLVKEQFETFNKLVEIKEEVAPEEDMGYIDDCVLTMIGKQNEMITWLLNRINDYSLKKYGPDASYRLKGIVEKKGGAQ